MSNNITVNSGDTLTKIVKREYGLTNNTDIMNTIKLDNKQIKVIAHRGVSGLERENTYPAFIAAGNRSYFGIETDIHVTKDNKFIVSHDDNIKRVSGVDLIIEESNYDEFLTYTVYRNGSYKEIDPNTPSISGS